MTIHQGSTPDGFARVWIDESDCSIVVERLLGTEWVVTLNWRARNLRVLAEHFSDEISYGHAVALLKSWNLPEDHPLWTLNHKGGLNHFTDR